MAAVAQAIRDADVAAFARRDSAFTALAAPAGQRDGVAAHP